MKKYLIISFLLICQINLFSQVEITATEVKEHIEFLASDELTGRFPGTEGDEKAAQYIKDDLKNSGLQLLFEDGYQFFEIQIATKATGTKKLQIGDFQCKYAEEYLPLYFSPTSKKTGVTVFAGYGMTIETDSLIWDDYKDVDVKDKWVVVLRGKPNIETYTENFFDKSISEYSKTLLATDKGAIGIIFVNGYENYPDDKLVEPCYSRFSEKAEIPAYSVKRYTGDRLLKYSKTNVKDVENKIKQDGKTVNLNLGVVVKNELTIEPVKVRTHNVVAVLEGSNPELRDEYIIIGAHYDHLGFGGCGSGSRKPDTLAVHNGADDNASGVSGVLEIAEYIAANQDKIGRSIIFITFGSEERGLIGSNYFVNNLPVPKDNIYAMLNMDMIGKYNGSLNIIGSGTAEEFEDIFNAVEYDTSELKLAFNPKPYSGSDHASFIQQGIPAVFFYASSGKDYHTPEDDAEFIDVQNAAVVMEYIAKSAILLSNNQKCLTFVDIKDENENKSHGSGVKLGITPSFEDTQNKGLKVSSVTGNSPAANGGILPNDIITAINNEPVNNIYDYMERLKKVNYGDKITVEINRNGEIITLEIQL